MQPSLRVITSEPDLLSLEEYFRDQSVIAFDTETTGVTYGSRVIGFSVCADEAVAYYVALERWNAKTSSMETVSTEAFQARARKLIESLSGKQLVMHNGVFDCYMVESYFKIRLIESLHTDTMILAHLLNENRKVGLKELGKALLGQDATQEQEEMRASILKNGGKITSNQYELYKADLELIGKYGAKDAWLTYRLFLDMVVELYEQGLDKFFYEEESMPLLRGPTYQLNTTGLKVDQQALTTLKKTLEAECEEAKNFVYSEIEAHVKDKYPGTSSKDRFNIGSSKQLSWLLFSKLGLEFDHLTDAGRQVCKHLGIKVPYFLSAKKKFINEIENSYGQVLSQGGAARKVKTPWDYIACDKKTLTKLAPKYKWIGKLLKYQRKMKILTTYVRGLEERMQYGLIRPSFLQHGTTSGRYSSRNPNFQNLPRDDKRVKACITARPGKKFVGADYSQLEPRVFAFFSNDVALRSAFDGTSDFYSVIGMKVYGKTDCTPHKEGSPDAFGVKYKRLRDLSKVIALASTYGATAYQLAPTTGKSPEDTQEDIDSYFEKFPGVRDMMLESHKTAKSLGQVVNLFGRPRRMPDAKKIDKIYGDRPHIDLPYEARNILNLACNHRIQSTAASIVNRAAIVFVNNSKCANINCNIIVQVHDSIVVECDAADVDVVALLLQHAMETTTKLDGVALEAVPKIGNTLADV